MSTGRPPVDSPPLAAVSLSSSLSLSLCHVSVLQEWLELAKTYQFAKLPGLYEPFGSTFLGPR